jgi:hypothetical protein
LNSFLTSEPFVKFPLPVEGKTVRVEVCINADRIEIGYSLTTSLDMLFASLVAWVLNSFSMGYMLTIPKCSLLNVSACT